MLRKHIECKPSLKKNQEAFSLKDLLCEKYYILSDKDVERLLQRELEKAFATQGESSILNDLTDVRSPDGMKVLHKGQGAKTENSEVKRRFVVEAKKHMREFMRIQKRSKILSTKHGRFLIEFQ